MNHLEYLLSYGRNGDFGRFRAAAPLALRRGERAVVRSHRGLEVGRVLRPAADGHAAFLPNTTVGRLLRRLTPADEAAAAGLEERGLRAFERGRALVANLNLPLEVIDAEALLDGDGVVLHLLRLGECDLRALVSSLSRELAAQVSVIDAGATAAEDEHDDHGCGDCGSGGGCGSCGTGGGGCGSCSAPPADDVRNHFAELRDKMERGRVPLV